jgi:hypothetical protein
MVPIVVLVGIIVGAHALGIDNALAWIVTLGFILPFFTIGGGTLAWALAVLTGHSPSWLSCIVLAGLPLGLFMTWFVLAD